MNTSLSTLREIPVSIPCGGVRLEGDLAIPAGAEGLVIFAHGSGSSRLSVRNRFVAGQMHHEHLATLLFDLLTPQEAREEANTGALRFNIPFLKDRLIAATRWAMEQESVNELQPGYFGASTGAAAALAAAAEIPEIKAVVSRGGRTDLAGAAAKSVNAATLLIVGELDYPVLDWNEQTLDLLPGVKQLSVIPGATHLFPEPEALEEVAQLAAAWFALHLSHLTPPAL
jgi:putative phosphoribosyl transferase